LKAFAIVLEDAVAIMLLVKASSRGGPLGDDPDHIAGFARGDTVGITISKPSGGRRLDLPAL
jgi:hypothetical protein